MDFTHQQKTYSTLLDGANISKKRWKKEDDCGNEADPSKLMKDVGTEVVSKGVLGDQADLQLRSR